MYDHMGFAVQDFAKSRAFYDKALEPLGIKMLMEFGTACGYGRGFKPEFWMGAGKTEFQTEEQVRTITPIHVAFTAKSREEVDAFYQAALAAGGKDNGAPGLRPQYHPHYYGAFVIDPDGHNIEAVFHG